MVSFEDDQNQSWCLFSTAPSKTIEARTTVSATAALEVYFMKAWHTQKLLFLHEGQGLGIGWNAKQYFIPNSAIIGIRRTNGVNEFPGIKISVQS